MKYQYEPLGDEYAFQTFLKDLFNAMYKTDSFEEYGSKGMAQFGVDIYSPELKIAIQAKKKDLNRSKAALIRELNDDFKSTLKSIDNFPHDIEQFYFATTTNRIVQLQDICMTESKSGNRKIKFFCWIDIQAQIAKYPAIRSTYYPALKENRPDYDGIQNEIKEKLIFLETLIREQIAAAPPQKKEFRSIPHCEILLPLMDIDGQKFLIAFIIKAAAIQTFKHITYKKFICIIDFSHTYTQFDDGTEGPGFSIFCGEVIFLGNIIKLMKMFQNNHEKFWNLYERYELDDFFNSINFRMVLLPREGLTSYDFELDGQTGSFQLTPVNSEELDYDKLNSLNAVLPFIGSTTKFGIKVIEFDKLKGFAAITKFIYCMLYENAFKFSNILVNVHDFDDWDYAYKVKERDD
jgi:hypothetical protein